jgi:hypothetical protein
VEIELNKFSCCDFSKVNSIGIICRGRSLGSIGKYKDYFNNSFIVGQHYKSLKLVGDHLLDSNIVKIWGSTFNKPSRGYKKQYAHYGIKDMQTYLDPNLSDRKNYKFEKIKKRNDGILEVFPRPTNFLERNKRFILKREHRRGERLHHPTIGLFSVDLAAAYKPKDIHIIGLDFYQAPDFVAEKKHIDTHRNAPRGACMIEYFKLLCKEERDIDFHLYTCCNKIKSQGNLKVIMV